MKKSVFIIALFVGVPVCAMEAPATDELHDKITTVQALLEERENTLIRAVLRKRWNDDSFKQKYNISIDALWRRLSMVVLQNSMVPISVEELKQRSLDLRKAQVVFDTMDNVYEVWQSTNRFMGEETFDIYWEGRHEWFESYLQRLSAKPKQHEQIERFEEMQQTVSASSRSPKKRMLIREQK